MTDAERIDRLERVVDTLITNLDWSTLPLILRSDLIDMLHEQPQQASGEGGSAE